MIGNAVATVVVARWETKLDRGALEEQLTGLKATPQATQRSEIRQAILPHSKWFSRERMILGNQLIIVWIRLEWLGTFVAGFIGSTRRVTHSHLPRS